MIGDCRPTSRIGWSWGGEAARDRIEHSRDGDLLPPLGLSLLDSARNAAAAADVSRRKALTLEALGGRFHSDPETLAFDVTADRGRRRPSAALLD